MTGSSTTEKDSEPKNLGAVFDAHVRAEFVEKDVAATMATMTAEPYLTHVPTMTGGTGRAEVIVSITIILSASGPMTFR
jgi:hypothetical protein